MRIGRHLGQHSAALGGSLTRVAQRVAIDRCSRRSWREGRRPWPQPIDSKQDHGEPRRPAGRPGSGRGARSWRDLHQIIQRAFPHCPMRDYDRSNLTAMPRPCWRPHGSVASRWQALRRSTRQYGNSRYRSRSDAGIPPGLRGYGRRSTPHSASVVWPPLAHQEFQHIGMWYGGVDPTRPLETHSVDDLVRIRELFLSGEGWRRPFAVVHPGASFRAA